MCDATRGDLGIVGSCSSKAAEVCRVPILAASCLLLTHYESLIEATARCCHTERLRRDLIGEGRVAPPLPTRIRVSLQSCLLGPTRRGPACARNTELATVPAVAIGLFLVEDAALRFVESSARADPAQVSSSSRRRCHTPLTTSAAPGCRSSESDCSPQRSLSSPR